MSRFDEIAAALRRKQREGKTNPAILRYAVETLFFQGEDAARAYLREAGDQQNFPSIVVKGEYHRDVARVEKFVQDYIDLAGQCMIDYGNAVSNEQCRDLFVQYPIPWLLARCLVIYGRGKKLAAENNIAEIRSLVELPSLLKPPVHLYPSDCQKAGCPNDRACRDYKDRHERYEPLLREKLVELALGQLEGEADLDARIFGGQR